jgi:ribosomal protein S30
MISTGGLTWEGPSAGWLSKSGGASSSAPRMPAKERYRVKLSAMRRAKAKMGLPQRKWAVRSERSS